ncbi:MULTISPECIES: hypothetical protein [unclassified Treponema]|uniref:DUF6998 domain-containing protein n=1 Tax=unclassified Treponema TaxID=2638727 RepID=UPI00068CA954|nr:MULTISPECIES: hypothetical protein [unclassified Treponema]
MIRAYLENKGFPIVPFDTQITAQGLARNLTVVTNNKGINMEFNFDFLVSLWKKYNNASYLLTSAMGGTANEVGEFAEILVGKYYNAEQLPASNKSADLKTKDGRLIQVKSRKIDRLKTTSLNVIRSWDFDILVVVLFDKEGNILKAIEIDSRTAEKLSSPNKYQNGKILTTNHELLNNKNSKDITQDLQNILDNKDSITKNALENNTTITCFDIV